MIYSTRPKMPSGVWVAVSMAYTAVCVVLALILVEGLGISGWKAWALGGFLLFHGMMASYIGWARYESTIELGDALRESNELVKELRRELNR